MRFLAPFAGALLLVLPPGCSSPQEQPRPVRRPIERPGSEAASVSSASVAPVSTEGVPIDLPMVLSLAGEKPNAVRLARERLAEAEAQTTGSLAGLLPSLVLGSNFARHQGTIQDTHGVFADSVWQHEFLGGTSELVVDTNGILAYLRDRQQRDAVVEDLESVTQERISTASTTYFDLVAAEANVLIARDALESARAFLAIAASRERNMTGLAVDRLRAESEVAAAKQGLILAEERAHVVSIGLANILRLDPKVTLHVGEREVRPLTLVSPETSPEDLISTALANHPEVRAAARRVSAADIEDDAAHYGPFLPRLRAGVGGYNGGFGYDGPNLGKLNDREDYYVAVELRFTGFGIGDYARAQQTGARLRAQKIIEEDTRERVEADVLAALQVVKSRSAAIEAAADELRAAEEARKIAQKRLEKGTGLAIDVILADEARTRAASHLVAAITSYNAAQYQLLARLGERPN